MSFQEIVSRTALAPDCLIRLKRAFAAASSAGMAELWM
jgi:hypothetical protein